MPHDMTSRQWLRALLPCCLLLPLWAQAAEPVTVDHAWVRATMPGQKVGAAYMDLQSAGDAALTSASSPVAESVEIHTMSMQQGVMQMRMLDKLPLPAGKTVQLAPGGVHLMLFGLKQPLQQGTQVALVLHFQYADGKTGRLQVSAPVKAVAHQH